MTDSNPVPHPGDGDPQNATRHREAGRIRQEREGWVVIWVPHESCYKAYPKFRAQRGAVASATQPGELIAQMDEIELAAGKPAGRSRKTSAT